MPAPVGEELAVALAEALAREARGPAARQPLSASRLNRLFFRLTWPRQTPATLIKVLTVMGIIINRYRLSLRVANSTASTPSGACSLRANNICLGLWMYS